MKFNRRLLSFMLAFLIMAGTLAGVAYAEGIREETVIQEEETPEGLYIQEDCCVLHLVIMVCALCVAVYYCYDEKQKQEEEFFLRSQLLQ